MLWPHDEVTWILFVALSISILFPSLVIVYVTLEGIIRWFLGREERQHLAHLENLRWIIFSTYPEILNPSPNTSPITITPNPDTSPPSPSSSSEHEIAF